MQKTAGYDELARIITEDVFERARSANRDPNLDIYNDIQKSVNFFNDFLTFYSSRNDSDRCRNVFIEYFKGPYRITSDETTILDDNRWLRFDY